MPKIWEPGRKEAALARLEALRADSRPAWGKFTPSRMLFHVTASIELALGEREIEPRISLFAAWPVKKLVIYAVPWPKGAETAKELLLAPGLPDPDFDESKVQFVAALERLAEASQDQDFQFPPHPMFGPLTPGDWGAFVNKHIEHHWKQFGL